jgi:hypothetical protein
VTDGNREDYPLLGFFQRQMICATKGLKGRLPDAEISDVEAAADAERWAAQVLGKRAMTR